MWLTLSGVPVAEAPQPLALSPLVVVGWQDRAQALWPSGPGDLWKNLHDAVNNPGGWQALGGNPSWGPIKLAHTRPTTSNSGAQALLLMAYGFYGKSSGLSAADVASPEFQSWLAEIEGGVPSFGDSSGALIDDMVRFGAAKYDFGIIYENLALQNMPAAQGRLRIFYPPATMLSEHPFAILQGEWVDSGQRNAAGQFRDFLLSRPIQELALQHGFRPADPGVSIETSVANNPFKAYAQSGVQSGISGLAETPSPEVVNALLELWQTKIGR
jgi:ABC-type Fe3+ transport system substrate-binding protein